jgi:hypothetical protein
MCSSVASYASGSPRAGRRAFKRLRRMSRQSGVRLAQVGFLLILIGGIWLAAAEIPLLEFARARKIVAGVLIAIGGLLLIIATQRGLAGLMRERGRDRLPSIAE